MKISHEITLCIPLILIVEISDIEINNVRWILAVFNKSNTDGKRRLI